MTELLFGAFLPPDAEQHEALRALAADTDDLGLATKV
jgi:hypothetical protein